jgi:hypothetical protein
MATIKRDQSKDKPKENYNTKLILTGIVILLPVAAISIGLQLFAKKATKAVESIADFLGKEGEEDA